MFDKAKKIFKADRQKGAEWQGVCPVCNEQHSLHIKEGDDAPVIAWCNRGCNSDEVRRRFYAALYEGSPTEKPTGPPSRGLTLAQYSKLKQLPEEFLTKRGVIDSIYNNRPSVRFTYPYGFKHRMDASLKADRATAWDKRPKSGAVDLYGLQHFVIPPDDALVICEGESCADTAAYLGIDAVGVPGVKMWKPAYAELDIFKCVDPLYVIEEPEAEAFARAVSDSFPEGRVKVLKFAEPVKDISALWLSCNGDREEFSRQWQEKTEGAITYPRSWQKVLRAPCELSQGSVRQLIEKILPEGNSMVGAASGTGKTYYMMTQAKALISGEKFLGLYNVPERMKVLYLCPEQTDRAIRGRLQRLSIPMDGSVLRVHTLNDATLKLDDPALLAACRDWRPVVFLDTAISFHNGKDENSASENATGLRALIRGMLQAGAIAIESSHHISKRYATNERGKLPIAELEALRGSGDLGAMLDTCWMLQPWDGSPNHSTETLAESKDLTRLLVTNVKPRDFDPAEPFVIQGRPYLDERGEFVPVDVWSNRPEPEAKTPKQDKKGSRAVEIVKANPKVTIKAISQATGLGRNNVRQKLEALGWVRGDGERDLWEQKATGDMEFTTEAGK